MRKKEMSDIEKAFVFKHIREGIDSGDSDEQLTKRREWLSEKFEISIETINAISAWARIRVDNAIPNCLSKGNAEFAKAYLALALNRDDELSLQKELADLFKVEVDTIRSVSRKLVRGPEYTDYRNEAKDEWRNTWKKFLEDNSDEKQRSNLKVLCLPGIQCLEIPVYLDLGFKPENIVGVEGGDRLARAMFELNATKLGIQSRTMELSEFLAQTAEKFDVVSLDFHGQLSDSTIRLLQQLPLAANAIVMVNTMGKRERKNVQQWMAWLFNRAKFRREEENKLEQIKADRQNMYLQDRGLNPDVHPALRKPVNSPATLSNTRDLVAVSLTQVGLGNSINWLLAEQARKIASGLGRLKPDIQSIEVVHIVQKMLEYHIELISQLLVDHQIIDPSDVGQIKLLYCMNAMQTSCIFGYSRIRVLEKYRYKSGSSANSPDYFSDMAVFHTPHEEYKRMSGFSKFLLTALDSVLRNEKSNEDLMFILGRRVGSKKKGRFRTLEAGEPASNGDHLFAITTIGSEVRNTICDIEIDKILKAATEFGKLDSEYPLAHWENHVALPRLEIT